MADLGILSTEIERPDLDSLLAAIQAVGISAVQLQLWSVDPGSMPKQTALQEGLLALPIPDADRRRAIWAGFQAHGLRLAAVDGTYNMIHPDPERRRRGAQRLEELIGVCQDLGTSIVTLCSGTCDPESMWRPHPDNTSSAAWTDLVNEARAAARVAQEHGVTLALEPEVSNVVDSVEKMRDLLDAVGLPSLQVLLDPANIFHSGELPRMTEKLDTAFALVGNHIALAHAKDLDHDGAAGSRAAGLGVLDFPHYLHLLQETGFDGSVVLHGLKELPEKAIGQSFDFVRRAAPRGYFQGESR